MVARSGRDAEVVCSNPVASTKTKKGCFLRPFFMIRTTVIYILVNSLVLTFEKTQSEPFCPVWWQYFYPLNPVWKTKTLQYNKPRKRDVFEVCLCSIQPFAEQVVKAIDKRTFVIPWERPAIATRAKQKILMKDINSVRHIQRGAVNVILCLR